MTIFLLFDVASEDDDDLLAEVELSVIGVYDSFDKSINAAQSLFTKTEFWASALDIAFDVEQNAEHDDCHFIEVSWKTPKGESMREIKYAIREMPVE